MTFIRLNQISKIIFVWHKKCVLLLCVFSLVILTLWLYENAENPSFVDPSSIEDEWKSMELKETLPIGRNHTYVVVWTGYPTGFNMERYCGCDICLFTTDRKFLQVAKAVVFYGSLIDIYDLPLPRPPNQLWALFHEEIPYYAPFAPFTAFLQHFNYTSTFSRHSDLPLTTLHLSQPQFLTITQFMMYTDDKDRFRKEAHLAPIAYIQSKCETMSGRDDYVRELMQYMDVDSYGRCLHNRDFPKSLNLTQDYLNHLMSIDFLTYLGRYKFILAYENAACDDYITDKFWRPLIVGAIPVYFGAPNIRDWEPHTKSVIFIDDFESPAALAEYLLKLDANNSEYLTYMKFKSNIQNQNILGSADVYYLEHFEVFLCYVCSKLNESPISIQTASLSHYDCVHPDRKPRMNRPYKQEWTFNHADAKCEALALDALLRRNVNFTKTEFGNLKDQCNK